MKELFIKKYWEEEQVFFLLHFVDDRAVEQIEIKNDTAVFLSLDNPFEGESMLFDQSLSDFEFDTNDIISRTEFYKIWNTKNG